MGPESDILLIGMSGQIQRILAASRRLHLWARVSAMVTRLLECHVSTNLGLLGPRSKRPRAMGREITLIEISK